jgi:hypothetical protein
MTEALKTQTKVTIPPGIFPITIRNASHYKAPWFFSWLHRNRRRLAKGENGVLYWGDKEPSFTYYEVDVVLETPIRGHARFYNMYCNIDGGRGELKCTEEFVLDEEESQSAKLKEHIAFHMTDIATRARDRREKERLEKIRQDEIALVHLELFGDWKP